ncbi:cyclase family protein [Agrobacterium rhizogenes]|uniref:cyclase family protein n=1 Tax=Rhizobium rhizogenes TaxID=359 RepID=UPI0015725257|nr:cyclase family protein [Rhizobium rhizogenes]NTH16805.1 cyclase family protein [Rhizobium rhizogenes]
MTDEFLMEPAGEQHDLATRLGAVLRSMRVVDLSPTLERGIPNWPMHPPLVIDKARLKARDGYYSQLLMISEHTGTHVDAPAHFHDDLMHMTIDTFPPDVLIAPAVLYDFSDKHLQPGDLISLDMVKTYEAEKGVQVGEGEIPLINFGWMQRYWRTDDRSTWFVKNAPGIQEDAIIYFKERGIRAIGCDTVACDMAVIDGVGQETTGHTTHWLPNGILIIEMLTNLHQLSLRSLFVATPMKIKEGSGSPIRPVAFCEGGT